MLPAWESALGSSEKVYVNIISKNFNVVFIYLFIYVRKYKDIWDLKFLS